MITIECETPLQNDVCEMVEELNGILNPLSPPEFQWQMGVEEMAEDATSLLVARDENKRAVGMGALKIHDDELGEIKRMYSRPQIRGAGVGYKLLVGVEELARNKGLLLLKLETGEGKGFEEAWRLYERCGYEQCGAFLDYPDSGWSRFYMKKLV